MRFVVGALERDPGHLEEDKVEVLLLEQRLVLARRLVRRGLRPLGALAAGGVRAPPEVRELHLQRRERAFRRFGLGLHRLVRLAGCVRRGEGKRTLMMKPE